MVPITEHEKLKKIADKSQACGEFIELLLSRGLLSRTRKSFNLLKELAVFFEIDVEKLEQEKLAMLDDMRRKKG